MSTKRNELLSIGGAIVSGIADIKSIFEKSETWIIVLCSSALLIFLILFLILKFRNNFDFISDSLDGYISNDEFSNFKNLHTNLIIDINDNYTDAKFILQRRIECMKSGSDFYKYIFSPFAKFQNFKPNIGFLSIEQNDERADIKHTLDKCYNKGDEIDLILTFDAVNLFEVSDNFWQFPKLYLGKEVVKVVIKLPKNFDFSSVIGKISINGDKRHKKPLRKQPYKDVLDDRMVLIIETEADELKVNQKLVINWKGNL